MHKPHECHLDGSWEELGPHVGHLGDIWLSCGSFPRRNGSLLAWHKMILEEQPNNTSHDSTTSPHLSAWPSGMREAA